MAQGSTVRLVRCPYCESLLPELPEFFLYQCGSCGAVLGAKKKENLSGKSDEVIGRGGSEKGLEGGRKKECDFLGRTANSIDSTSSRTASWELVKNFDQNSRRVAMNLRVDHGNEDGDYRYLEDRYTQVNNPMSIWVQRNDHEVTHNRKTSEFGNSHLGNEVEKFEFSVGDFSGSLRSRPVTSRWDVERNGSMAFDGNGKGVAEQGRMFSTFRYQDEGPSSYHYGSFHCFAEQKRIHHVLDRPSRVDNFEHDRAEILRKIDELKDQLSRSGDLTEKPRERVPADRTMAPSSPLHPVLPSRYSGYNPYVPEGPTSLYTGKMEPFAPIRHVSEPLRFNGNHSFVPHINSHNLDMQDFYPSPRSVPNEFGGYDGFNLPQRLRRPPHQPPPQYSTRPYHDHFPGQDMDFKQRTLASHQHQTFSHQLACSCSQCDNKNGEISPKVPQPAVRSRSQNDTVNPVFSHLKSPVTYGPQGYNSKGTSPPHMNSLNQQPQMGSSIDSGLEIGGVAQQNPRMARVARGSERACHPITGGAPFLTCCSCFQLLKLRRKLVVIGKNQQKVRCGACSAIILIEFEKKGRVVSISTVSKQVSAQGDDGSGETLNENLKSSPNRSIAGGKNSCSDDYDNSGYKFQLTDTDTQSNVLSIGQRLDFGESNERQEPPSSSTSSFSEDEQSPDRASFRRYISISADLPPKDDSPSPFSDSLQQQDPENASSDDVVSRNGMGNDSKPDDQDKVILDRSKRRQNSVKDDSVATEMEVPFSNVSQDSAEVRKEENQPSINEGSESFHAGITGDALKSSQSVETGRPNVFVNGQPIPNRLVEKAEKLAGPIEPGNYWYDYQAGFWGVMGQPCLGIIPPFIQEFKYPMPENCAAGNTGVFVNGRELNQKDLDLLAGRGLPTIRDRSYVIDLSGRVLDEDTGEELDSLGKLAPTVERANQGFGMRNPRGLTYDHAD